MSGPRRLDPAWSRRRLGGIQIPWLTVAVVALVAFVPPWLLLGPIAAAAAGVAVYALLLATLRPPELLASWRYLRALV
jgi:hypothetical protein